MPKPTHLFRLGFALCLLWALPAEAQPSFIAFESGPVRPITMVPGSPYLAAVNTPDNTVEIFLVSANGLTHAFSVPVGMEPVAVAARDAGEVWVVNHLSDSVSVVDIVTGRVTRTLLVGDEPRDIVFADPDGNGPLASRAFITTAHRGQHRVDASIAAVPGAGDPQLTTPGVDRADVWVFDGANPGTALGGTPLEIVTLFGDTPRALAVDQGPTSATVYAAIFHSGNQSTTASEGVVCDGFGGGACSGDGVSVPGGLGGGQMPGGLAAPSTNKDGVLAPETGIVVKYNKVAGTFEDQDGRNWTNAVRFDLPDKDVFAIDADTLNETAFTASVGTINFNMVVNPVSGKLYVSNTEANNLRRFEGPGCNGVAPVTGTEVGSIANTVNGKLALSRVSVLPTPNTTDATGATVQARHLNKHIDYSILSIECDGDPNPAYPAGQKAHSLATPTDMVVDSTGSTLYVAAFGSSKVGVFSTSTLENDTFDPTVESANYFTVSGGGPSGLALDEARGRLYVATRFDNSISVIDIGTGVERNHIPLHNPEPPEVKDGRPILYDAVLTSGNGEASCSSCHIFGDMDDLAWDLGNPDDHVTTNPLTINLLAGAGDQNGGASNTEFHPMKGPMTTQTLRGMSNSGAMHWRGDRADGHFGLSATDEDLSFRNFIVAFPGLVGSTGLISDSDMQRFADFQLSVQLPPNPVRPLDNSLTTAQAAGHALYTGVVGGNGFQGEGGAAHTGLSDGVPVVGGLGFTCEGCHRLDAAQGFFGTGKEASFENETQIMKIPHLRNLYAKVGMFGMPNVAFNLTGDNSHQGPQVRGFGFLHDGSTDTLFRFFTADVFSFNNNNPVPFLGGVGFNTGATGDTQRQNVEEFMLAFDSDLAPIVGQQVTLDATNETEVGPRIALLVQRADTNFTSEVLGGLVKEADLVAKAKVGGRVKGWLYNPGTGFFDPDTTGDPALSDSQLRDVADTAGQEVTYTAAPPGSGYRMALDRDNDGVMDGDEFADGTDPANPGSLLGACNDGIDNDGDGLIDAGDPGCKNITSPIENPACDDGYDNDNDTLVDAADPHCTSPWVTREKKKNPACGLLGIESIAIVGAAHLLRRRRREPSGL